MGMREKLPTFVWVLLVVLFTIFAIRFNRKGSDFKSPPHPTPLPPAQSDDGYAWFYDWESGTWILKQIDFGRANDNKEPGVTQDQLEDHLKKKVPGYLEDTYWGEEYDLDGQVPDD
jgi:hypothetical protein